MKLLIPGCFIFVLLVACSSDGDGDGPMEGTSTDDDPTPVAIDREETFTITSDGTSWKAKIWIPSAYETNRDLPSIYLIDHEEMSFAVVPDEFEKVVAGVKAINGFDALVITLSDLLPHIVASDYEVYKAVFKELAAHVEANYTDNPSRTFVGRGGAAGIVLSTLFLEEPSTAVFQNFIVTTTNSITIYNELMENEDFPQDKDNTKLHYSFDGESDVDLNMKFINTVTDKAYPWLEFEWAEYANLGFNSSYPSAFADGIKFIFED